MAFMQLLNPPQPGYRIDITGKNPSALQKTKRQKMSPFRRIFHTTLAPNKMQQSYWFVEFQRVPLLRRTYYMRFITRWHKSAFLPRGGLSSCAFMATLVPYCGCIRTVPCGA